MSIATPVVPVQAKPAAPSKIPAGAPNPALLAKFQSEVINKINTRVIPLTPGELLVHTVRGFYMVVPGWNIDVAPGIVRDGMIEPWTNEVLLSVIREGDGVINVGANFGYYALLAAQRVGRGGQVYAVEANPVVFPYLVKSAYWGGYPDVIRMFNAAAASPEFHGKTVEFYFEPQFIGGGGMNPFASCQTRRHEESFWSCDNIDSTLDGNRQFAATGVYSKITAHCRTVDSMVPNDAKIAAMLIDAEGSECFVISGAKETIRRNPSMALIVEWSPHVLHDPNRRDMANAMWDFLLNERGYKAYRIAPEGYPGLGAMPALEPVTRESLAQVPHSDIFLKK